MPTREALSNFVITLVALFFMALLGLLLKARYRLPSEREVQNVPKAIPVARQVAEPVAEARAYKSGEFWVLPHPQLVVSRANEPDTLRIRSGPKEDVFVLYFADALEATWQHPKRVSEQAAYYGRVPVQRVLDLGGQALGYVTQLLTHHPFKVYTKWTRLAEVERYYAMITVETEPGKYTDLASLLVRKGLAAPNGVPTNAMPEEMKAKDDHVKDLQKALAQARTEHAGIWAHVP